jgi:hypothetical protein
VFYHRAGLLNDYDAVTNIATLYVSPQDVSQTFRDDIWTDRSGLPGPLADAYASASESEEEDEADEDSNGMSHYLQNNRHLRLLAAYAAQRRSTTRMTTQTRRALTMARRKIVTVRVLASLAVRSVLWKQLRIIVGLFLGDFDEYGGYD